MDNYTERKELIERLFNVSKEIDENKSTAKINANLIESMKRENETLEKTNEDLEQEIVCIMALLKDIERA